MVNRMRHNRAQRGDTRSHHALTAVSLSTCPDCQAKKLSHRACSNCGKYNGRTVIDVLAKTVKKEKKLQVKSKEEGK